MKQKKRKQPWMRKRHQIITRIASALLYPYTRLKYGVKIERFREQGNRPYLILMNHQTGFDQFFVGMAFKGAIYYVATEDIFSLGFLSSLLRFAVAPIPIKKQTTDIGAVKNCYRVAKEGGTIAIAPEGNRTYDGKTAHINPAIAQLAKTLKLPIAFFRIEGGYGVQPRWSDVVRRGKMRAYVSRILEPEEYMELPNDAFMEVIRTELDVNEACLSGTFKHKKSAEYLERAIYVCPDCGLSTFESNGTVIHCKKCGRKIQYLPTKELKGIDKPFPFRFVAEWYDYQCNYIHQLNPLDFTDAPLYEERVTLSEVIIYKKKVPMEENILLRLYGDRITLTGADGNEMVYPFENLSAISVLGKNKFNFYHEKRVYQVKGDARFNALKYVNMYYRHKNVTKQTENAAFLGV